MILKIRKIEKDGSSENRKPVRKVTKKSVSFKPKAPAKKPIKEDRYEKYEEPVNRQVNMDDILIYFYEKYDGDWYEIYNAINRKERVEGKDAVRLVERNKKDYDYTTIIDDEYPVKYKLQDKPPFVIKKKKKIN